MLTVLKILSPVPDDAHAAPGLAHLFELPNKIGLPRDAYFAVQGTIPAGHVRRRDHSGDRREPRPGVAVAAVQPEIGDVRRASAGADSVQPGVFFTWTFRPIRRP